MILAPQKLVLFQGMDVKFKGKNMLHYSRGVKRQQGFTTGAAFYVYNVISFTLEMVHHGLVVIMPEIQISDRSVVRGRIPGGNDMICSQMFDIVNLLFKNHGGKQKHVVVFVVWSALVVVGWVVVGQSRKSYSGLAEISSLFVPGLIRGLGTQGESKISSCCF